MALKDCCALSPPGSVAVTVIESEPALAAVRRSSLPAISRVACEVVEATDQVSASPSGSEK